MNKSKVTYTLDDRIKIANNMIRFGGSFMRNLGEALMVADSENSRKILEAWAVDCEKYINID